MASPIFMHKFTFWLLLLCMGITGQAYDLSRVEHFLSSGDISHAKQALAEEYIKAQSKKEQEELEFLAAQIFVREGNYSQAADIYRKILANNPSLTRVRLELGYVYFLQEEDEKARYNFWLALAAKDLPATVQQKVESLLEKIRRRKKWALFVSLGLAPDSNVNLVSGRAMSCINFMGTPICQELEREERAIGFQGAASFEYIFKFNDSWGLKSHLMVDALDYKDKQYSFWSIGGAVGPRYISGNGEYSAGILYRQQFNDNHRYNYTKGIYGDFSTDLSRRLFISGRLSYNRNEYNQKMYQTYNGNNYAGYSRLIYGLNNHSYVAVSAGLSYEDSRYKWNSFWRQSYGVGYGRELPWGFVAYVEPNISFVNYWDKRYFLNGHGGLEQWKRQDVVYGVQLSISNKLWRLYNITPTIRYIYNKRHSNVHNYGYERNRLEVGISRSF